MARAYLGLGSNLGDKKAMLAAALHRLQSTAGITIVARSGLFRTPPWGLTDQDWFLNAAVAIDTALPPHALLSACLQIEESLGRRRDRKWGPRTIDIDLLTYADLAVQDARLVLPHPHMMERAFVLAPLVEIAPHLIVNGMAVSEALAGLDQAGLERLPDD